MKILSIDTSCDETSAAVTDGRRVLSNVLYSQVLIHAKWGGVVPSIAKRAHEERIDWVISEAVRRSGSFAELFSRDQLASRKNDRMDSIDYIAVTYGPGLAIALEVGIKKAKELAERYNKKLIAVNHMEGHIYSSFVQSKNGRPERPFEFPYIVLLISGAHTELVLWKNHLEYEILSETVDDAAGEALDKAARILGFGYPGGPVMESLAKEVDNEDKYKFPRPMRRHDQPNFSFSGLKTSFLYYVKQMPEEEKAKNLKYLASSFQEAIVDSLLFKTEQAIKQTGVSWVVVGGGVAANLYLRHRLRALVKKHKGSVYFPPFKYLTGDNATMIGVAAHYKALSGLFVEDFSKLDRVPRLSL